MDREELGMMVAHNIQTAMDARGLNAAALAKLAKINPAGVYDILSGRSRSPRLDTVHKIAAALKLPIAELLEERNVSRLREDLLAALEEMPEQDRLRLLAVARAWRSEG